MYLETDGFKWAGMEKVSNKIETVMKLDCIISRAHITSTGTCLDMGEMRLIRQFRTIAIDMTLHLPSFGYELVTWGIVDGRLDGYPGEAFWLKRQLVIDWIKFNSHR